PIAVNASLLVGYRMAGLPGAATTIFGTVLPPLILLSLIAVFYTQFRDSRWIDAALRGIRAAVAAVMVDAVVGIIRSSFKAEKLFPALLMGAAFLLSLFTDAPVALILLASGLVGWLATRIRDRRTPAVPSDPREGGPEK
ncbi:MAG: chromate transporter, partial [Clostridia bacterium]|nr:chromate transporter [Clostridia bacterium]